MGQFHYFPGGLLSFSKIDRSDIKKSVKVQNCRYKQCLSILIQIVQENVLKVNCSCNSVNNGASQNFKTSVFVSISTQHRTIQKQITQQIGGKNYNFWIPFQWSKRKHIIRLNELPQTSGVRSVYPYFKNYLLSSRPRGGF